MVHLSSFLAKQNSRVWSQYIQPTFLAAQCFLFKFRGQGDANQRLKIPFTTSPINRRHRYRGHVLCFNDYTLLKILFLSFFSFSHFYSSFSKAAFGLNRATRISLQRISPVTTHQTWPSAYVLHDNWKKQSHVQLNHYKDGPWSTKKIKELLPFSPLKSLSRCQQFNSKIKRCMMTFQAFNLVS